MAAEQQKIVILICNNNFVFFHKQNTGSLATWLADSLPGGSPVGE